MSWILLKSIPVLSFSKKERFFFLFISFFFTQTRANSRQAVPIINSDKISLACDRLLTVVSSVKFHLRIDVNNVSLSTLVTS